MLIVIAALWLSDHCYCGSTVDGLYQQDPNQKPIGWWHEVDSAAARSYRSFLLVRVCKPQATCFFLIAIAAVT